MDKHTCKICGKEYETLGGLHKHFKAHQITQTEYYQTYYPRHDRYDGRFIRYKNHEYYFHTDFNSKENLKLWLAKVPYEQALGYVLGFLMERKERKSLSFMPTQAELKTLMLPGIKHMQEHLGGYADVANRAGLQLRFTNWQLDQSKFKDISRKVIFADTREQNPLDFDNTTREEGLKFGDYRMAGSTIFIERKSLADFWGTLSGGFERFTRELERAEKAGAYLVILVESPFVSLEGFPNRRQVQGKIKIPVEFIYHNIRLLMQKFNHIQFLFVRDRDEASRVVKQIFRADDQVRNVDLQYLYDTKQL